MKNEKKPAQRVSEYLIILLVLAGMFGYFKFKWSSKKDDHTIATQSTSAPKDSVLQPTSATSPVVTQETQETATQEPIKQGSQLAAKKPDPLLIQVATFSQSINENHENKLRGMFKSEQKEEYMEKYLTLKQERSQRMHELLKTDNSRASIVKLNYEFHNKFYEIIGKDLYTKYLKVLKETNDDAKNTRIVLEF